MELVQKKGTKTKVKETKTTVLNPAVEETVEKKPATEYKMKSAMQKSGQAVKTLFTKRRKFLVLSTMFALLCVTGYLNFALNSNQSAVQTGGAQYSSSASMMSLYRNAREDIRTRDIQLYTNLKNTGETLEIRENASNMLMELTTNIRFETDAEFYIMTSAAIGASDVMVNRSGDFVNVLLKRDTNIDDIQATAIMTYLQSLQEGLDIDNVYISMM